VSFGTLLVANRGEIAVRVLRAARAAGLRTVAVYSDVDREAPHVRAADTAVHIGPAAAAESYLSVQALLDAARRSGAEAVHPGYGFLSEQAAFARACLDAGLAFVGPPAAVMELMGRKDEARRVALAAGVPVLPAVEGADDASLIARAIAEIGFPLLVKAAAGGGGKGMRIVREAAELPAALAAARREARSAFGDDTMLIERYVERGRHVEVQVLADVHGHVVHLFERDCSVQRRHQKVLEESPAPTISSGLRAAVTEAAVRLTREVGYVNAGTVEFLVPDAGRGDEAWFLEMNTRLQVEHPVTELVTGLDLVRLQLEVAQGRPLPFGQADVRLDGHAIEARVYAEDPESGFLPQAGVATTVRWSDRSRVDAALESGQRVGTWYDPILGKVIAHGVTREAARLSLLAAIDDTAIVGLATNLGFLRRLVASDAFRDSAIDTAWLDRQAAAFPHPDADVALCAAAWAMATAGPGGHATAGTGREATAGNAREAAHPFGVADGWRLAGPPAPVTLDLEHAGRRHAVLVDPAKGVVTLAADPPPHAGLPDGSAAAAGDSSRSGTAGRTGGRAASRTDGPAGATVDGRVWTVHPIASDGGRLRLEIDGIIHETQVESGPHGVTVVHRGESYTFRIPDRFAPGGPAPLSDGVVSAPMPGTVLAVHAREGQQVSAGTVLGVLEAMKMELALPSPYAGTVEKVTAAVGDQVPLGHPLFVIAPEE